MLGVLNLLTLELAHEKRLRHLMKLAYRFRFLALRIAGVADLVTAHYLPNQALEWQLADKKFRRLLIAADLL